jgi:hypothetical protein
MWKLVLVIGLIVTAIVVATVAMMNAKTPAAGDHH